MSLRRRSKVTSIILSFFLVFSLLSPIYASAKNNQGQSIVKHLDQAQLQQLQNHIKMLRAERGTADVMIDDNIDTESDTIIRVIVEFRTEPVAVQTSAHTGIKASKAEAVEAVSETLKSFKADLAKMQIPGKVTSTYDTVFSGVALELKASDILKLKKVHGVKAVYANNKIEPTPVQQDQEVQPYMKNSAPHIGANDLWNLGYEGDGLKIGVIDTGIDYNHPDLKDAYVGGYDFVDNDSDPYEGNELVQSVHGTHVSGTVAGRGNPETGGVRGIAPMADLHVYRVLGPNGGWDEWVISGIEKAVEEGMDVINLSLGAAVNHSDAPTARAVNNAMLAGTVAVVANGNYGEFGYSTVAINKKEMTTVIDYIHSHYTESIRIEQMAALYGLSKYHFIRVFQKHTGLTPYQFVQEVRFDYALKLIKTSQKSITQIAYEVGLSDKSLHTMIRQRFNVTPAQFRDCL